MKKTITLILAVAVSSAALFLFTIGSFASGIMLAGSGPGGPGGAGGPEGGGHGVTMLAGSYDGGPGGGTGPEGGGHGAPHQSGAFA